MAAEEPLLKIIGSAKQKFDPVSEFGSVSKSEPEYTSGKKLPKGVNLYVCNLDDRIDDDHLWDLFSPFGTILSSIVICDNYGSSKGYGFVHYSTAEEAENAIASMDGHTVFSRVLHVSVAREKKGNKNDCNYVRNQQKAHFQHFEHGKVNCKMEIQEEEEEEEVEVDDDDDDDGEPHGHQDTVGASSRFASLLNQKTFSDVQFSVGRDVFYAHRLVLALSSKVFASMFYGENALTELKTIVISDITSRGFYNMLKYMYADYLELDDVIEAKETLKASQKFDILDLETKCREYLFGSCEEITAANVCFIFENADISNINNVVSKCRNIFQTETKDVLKSSHFMSSDLATVEAILKNDSLNIDSELDLIKAVHAWGKEDCKRKNVAPDATNVRACVGPLLEHIRFLSLPTKEFLNAIKETELLSTPEACMLTLRLSQPEIPADLPPGICHKTSKRSLPAISKLSYCYFKFPLVKTEQLFSTGFKADIVSTVQLTMQEGQIKMHGVILQIRKLRFQIDVLDISVDVHSDLEEYSFQKQIEVTDEPITVMLKRTLHIPRKHSATLRITIEDLLLNRCYSCRESDLSIEKPDTKVKIHLSGNRTNEDCSFLFPVNLLLYEECWL